MSWVCYIVTSSALIERGQKSRASSRRTRPLDPTSEAVSSDFNEIRSSNLTLMTAPART